MNDEFSLFPYQYALEEAGRLTYSPSHHFSPSYSSSHRLTTPTSFSDEIPPAFSSAPSSSLLPSPPPAYRLMNVHANVAIFQAKEEGGTDFLNGARLPLRFAAKLPAGAENNESPRGAGTRNVEIVGYYL